MDEHATREALRAMSPRMRGADIEALVGPVMGAWNDVTDFGQRVTRMTAVVDAVWPHGYAAGALHGHRFVTDSFAWAAKQTLTGQRRQIDPNGQRMLRAVAGVAAAVAASEPTVTDTGPGRYDYLTATGDANGSSAAEEAAIAARVGWMHGFKAGNSDAGWSTTTNIISLVHDLLGEDAIRLADISGQDGKDWLNRLDVQSRNDSEQDMWHPRPSAAQAFPPLRQVSATPTTPPAPSTSEGAAQQRHGRSR